MANNKTLPIPIELLKITLKLVENNQFESASKILKEGLINFPKEFLLCAPLPRLLKPIEIPQFRINTHIMCCAKTDKNEMDLARAS